MDPLIILIALLAAPVLLIMVLRINAAQVFLSLCLGNVLVQFIGQDAGTILASATARPPGMPAGQSYVNLILLLLPVVLTMLIMMHSVKGGAKLAYNFLPALGASLLLALLAVPLLSADLTGSITTLPLWQELENLQTLILSVSTLLCLLFLWMQRPKKASKEEAKHH
ncbi:MAG TPA: hypothetical protein VK978_00500 [Candidatus Saccharimonadales bacterium]|nr:hypothetical protein [Candidatus Saccharimonadales bacterium]